MTFLLALLIAQAAVTKVKICDQADPTKCAPVDATSGVKVQATFGGTINTTCHASTAAPSYTDNTDDPLSCDLAGGLRTSGGGGGGGSSFVDSGAFTAGVTTLTLTGGVFNDGLSALSSGKGATPRLTSFRALHFNIRDNSGNEVPFPAALDADGGFKVHVQNSTSSTVTQGTNPWIIADSRSNVTAAWTSATSVDTRLSVDVTNLASVVYSSNNTGGSISGGNVVFEGSDDGGTTWKPVVGWELDGQGSWNVATLTLISNSASFIGFNVAGLNKFAARLNPVITGAGTANVSLSASAETLPLVYPNGGIPIQTASNGAILDVNLKRVNGVTILTGNGTALNTPRVTIANDNTAVPVDVSDRAARLLGVVYGSQGQQLKQTATNFNAAVESFVGGSAIDPRSIRLLTSSDVVDVSDRSARLLGHVTVDNATLAVTQSGAPWSENLTQVNSSAITLGSGTPSANTPRVAIATSDGSTLATANGGRAQVDIITGGGSNASVVTDGAAPGSSDTQVGASVTTAAPSYTNGQIKPLSLNTAGGLRVDGSGVTQPVVQGALNSITSGQQALSPYGPAASLPSASAKSVCFYNSPQSADFVWMGGSGAVNNGNGRRYAPGEGDCRPVSNANLLFFFTQAGATVEWDVVN